MADGGRRGSDARRRERREQRAAASAAREEGAAPAGEEGVRVVGGGETDGGVDGVGFRGAGLPSSEHYAREERRSRHGGAPS
uniref:Uncharacterized protein n=2 Tax=Oryza sativa subsp. japonica TaxID=39947 RepID=Q53Q12_ORYSJ|nr:hypothetical protein [Oryza sativa Japonica Group]ABA92330.1 hypothetical protein LOC_Os11g13830 [Oryza sativa Japonica Group]